MSRVPSADYKLMLTQSLFIVYSDIVNIKGDAMNRFMSTDPGARPALYPELGANTTDRPHGELPVTGTLPDRLRGGLYRNGPGMFHRAGRAKSSVLDRKSTR